MQKVIYNYQIAIYNNDRIINLIIKKEEGQMATKKVEEVIIRPIERKITSLTIVGDSPLIMHAWDIKSKRQMLMSQLKWEKTKQHEAKNPMADFISSMYWLTPMPEEMTEESFINATANGARFGFPVTAFKQAAISAAYRMGWTKDKVSARGAFFINPSVEFYYGGEMFLDEKQKDIQIIPNRRIYSQMVEIESDDPIPREDMVRVGMGSADIRYRGEFRNWSAKLEIQYNANGNFSLEQIINMINAGGYVCGVGEWRPEKDGQYGMFHVVA